MAQQPRIEPVATPHDGQHKQLRLHPKKRMTKVRTGCQTCKSRHVKCDEQKPCCVRCTSTGRPCGGYSNRFSDTKRRSTNNALVSSYDAIHVSTSPPGVQTDAQDKDLFYFIHTSAFDLLQDSLPTKKLFESILRVAHIHPPVWHATIALAASFRSYITPSDPRAMDMAAFKQCNSSIKELVKLDSAVKSPIEKAVILSTAMLFACVACVQGIMDTSVLHVQSGIKLYMEWCAGDFDPINSNTPSFPLPLEYLTAMYLRLDNQVRIVLNAPSSTFMPSITHVQTYHSTDRALLELEHLLHMLLRHLHGPDFRGPNQDPRNPTHQIYHQDAFAEWDKKVFRFSNTLYGRTEINQESLHTLAIRRQLSEIFMHIDPGEGEMGWDRFLPEFELIVDLVGRLSNRATSRTSKAPKFTFASSISEALFIVGMRCRVSSVRRKALELLKRRPVKEGVVWDNAFGVGVVERVIDAEDTFGRQAFPCCSSGEICASHRVAKVIMGFPDQRIRTEGDEVRNENGREGLSVIVECTPLPDDASDLDVFKWVGLTWAWPPIGPQKSTTSSASPQQTPPTYAIYVSTQADFQISNQPSTSHHIEMDLTGIGVTYKRVNYS